MYNQSASGGDRVSSTNAAILKLNKVGLAKGLDNLLTYADSGASVVTGWLVADRIPADSDGSGVDAITRVDPSLLLTSGFR